MRREHMVQIIQLNNKTTKGGKEMEEKKLYYLGTGLEFVKAQCKEYKTLDGAQKAAAKDESFVVWDEEGVMIGSIVDEIPDGVQGAEGDVSESEASENAPESNEATNTPSNDEKDENEADAEQEQGGNGEEAAADAPKGEKPQGKVKVTVICDGTLNLRRTPSFEKGNECGRASRGQSYYVAEVYEIDGKKMVETVDGIYLSGASEHVEYEQL